jgi:hypothetical protein
MAEHGIHQGGFAMVNVSDNGDISDSFLHGVLLLVWCSLGAKEKDGQSARLLINHHVRIEKIYQDKSVCFGVMPGGKELVDTFRNIY